MENSVFNKKSQVHHNPISSSYTYSCSSQRDVHYRFFLHLFLLFFFFFCFFFHNNCNIMFASFLINIPGRSFFKSEWLKSSGYLILLSLIFPPLCSIHHMFSDSLGLMFLSFKCGSICFSFLGLLLWKSNITWYLIRLFHGKGFGC